VDLTHGNSIEVMHDGNYLVSLRNVSQVVKIDSTTGGIIWRLGGAGVSEPASGAPTGDFVFKNDPTGFSCQHAARELPNGDIILFDDGNGHTPQESRAVEYALDTTARTATMVWSSKQSAGLYTSILGYGQRLSNGDTLVAYGLEQVLEEWNPDATRVLWRLAPPTAQAGLGYYRAYRLGSLYSYSPP